MSPPRDQNSNGSRVDDAPAPSLRQLKEILSSGSANPEGTSGNRGGAAPGSFGSATPGRPTGERSDTGAESPDRVLTADELLTLVTPDATTNDTEVTSRALAPVSSAPARSLRAPVAFDDPVVVRPRRLGDRRARRRTGVAPFVRPSQRRSRRQRRRDYRKLGFIELTQEKARLRHRVLPRTVLGVSSMMLALGVGAAFAGASLYAYYDYRLTENETRVDEFAKGFENNFASAISEVQKARDGALQSIGASATLLQDWVDASNAVVELPQRVGGGVFLVRTLDPAGKSVLGSAFVVSSSENESLLLTSYQLVAAATAQPGPQVSIQHGQDQMTAAVWTWDPQLDLALLKVDRGGLPSLQWASDAERAEVRGGRIYVVSAIGAPGATAAQAMVIDQSEAGIRLDSAIEADFRGGPIVNAAGQVLGIANTGYLPLGFATPTRPYVPLISQACTNGERGVLVCPEALTAVAPRPQAAPAQQGPPGAATPTTAAPGNG